MIIKNKTCVIMMINCIILCVYCLKTNSNNLQYKKNFTSNKSKDSSIVILVFSLYLIVLAVISLILSLIIYIISYKKSLDKKTCFSNFIYTFILTTSTGLILPIIIIKILELIYKCDLKKLIKTNFIGFRQYYIQNIETFDNYKKNEVQTFNKINNINKIKDIKHKSKNNSIYQSNGLDITAQNCTDKYCSLRKETLENKNFNYKSSERKL